MVVSKEEIAYLQKSFGTANAIFSLDNISQHLADGRPAYGYNSFLGMIVSGFFGWLDYHRSPDYSIIMDPNQNDPFKWVSWEEFKALRIIRNAFTHTFHGIIDSGELKQLQNFKTKLDAGNAPLESPVDGSNVPTESYFEIEENSNSGSKEYKVRLNLQVIQRTALFVVRYDQLA